MVFSDVNTIVALVRKQYWQVFPASLQHVCHWILTRYHLIPWVVTILIAPWVALPGKDISAVTVTENISCHAHLLVTMSEKLTWIKNAC